MYIASNSKFIVSELGTLKMLRFLLKIFVTLALFTSGNCADEVFSSCLLKTCDTKGNAIFKPNHTYVYDYRVEIKAENSKDGNFYSKNVSSFGAIVEIYADPNCNLIMKLDDVYFYDEQNINKSEISDELMKNSMIFQFDNGKVMHICAAKPDSSWTVNIKLGILSALQYNLRNDSKTYYSAETDICGECGSMYNVSEADGWTVIRRMTNLNNCYYRSGFYKQSQFLYDTSSYLSTVQFVNNYQKCRHVLGNTDQPILITCREFYTIDPFMNENYIKLSIKQQLDLDRVIAKDVSKINEGLYESMEYRYPNYTDKAELSDDIMKSSLDMIKLYCYNRNENIIKNLTILLRKTTYDDLRSIYKLCDDEEKSYFTRTLLNILTEDALHMLLFLYKMNALNSNDLKFYLSMLSFIENPTIKSLSIIQPLVNIKDLQPNIQLGVSGLIYNFCNEIEECMDIAEVNVLIKQIESPLSFNYEEKRKDDFIIALASIGNIGYTYSLDKIVSIYQNRIRPSTMRQVAIDAYRRMPCQYVSREPLFNIFSDQTEGVEMRLRSYLSIIQCPTNEIIRKINEVLQNEDVNQVTHSVWGHLTDMQNSSSTFTNNITNILIDKNTHVKHRMNYDNNLLSYFDTIYLQGENKFIFNERVNTEMQDVKLGSFMNIFKKRINVFSINANIKESINSVEDGLKKTMCKENKLIPERANNIQKDKSDKTDDYIWMRIFGNDIYYFNSSDMQEYLRTWLSKTVSIKFIQDLEVVNAYYHVPSTVGLPVKVSVSAKMNMAMNSTIKINYKDYEKCVVDLEGQSLLKMSSTVSTSLTIGIMEHDSGFKSADDFEVNTVLNHHVQQNKKGNVYIITN